MPGAGAQVGEPRLVRRDDLGVADELDGLVGEVGGEVIALFGSRGCLDGVVVVNQFRVPLVGLPAQESIEPLESPRQRPVPLGGGEVGLLQWRHVPFARAVGVVPTLGEYLRDQRGVLGDATTDAGKSLGELLNDRHAHRRRVAAGQQRGAGRRTQCGGVELGETHALLSDARHGRHVDQSTEAVPGRDPDVVPDHIEHVGRTGRRGRRLERSPVGRRVADVQGDFASELSSHETAGYLLSRQRRRWEAHPLCQMTT